MRKAMRRAVVAADGTTVSISKGTYRGSLRRDPVG
ncbi:hypothetical protein FHX81_7873 [Saccharothrix saharensis]|uniref:Uncharacterized protein n=1 Tax=Saccharothrix saharensis TaxID=571190 RepID=A0A543JRB6_9PSEU|nr:hypothetical protein FHX81_7873 [Saccharothrix saharensis]